MTFHKMMPLSALALMLAGCSSAPQPTTQASTPPTPTPAPAPASLPRAEDDSITVTGPVIVENQIDVAAQRDGMVSKLMVEVGEHVRRGQALGFLDDRQLTAERDAAVAKQKSIAADVKNWEAETRVQESDLARAEQMMKNDLITKQELDHARYKVEASRFEVERERENLNQATANAKSLEMELEKTRISAPFYGVVARRYVRVGQKVATGDKLFWVTAVAPLRVKFTLPEKYLGRVKKGEEVQVTSEYSPQTFHARVLMVSPVVDPSSGTIEVLAELVGPTGELRPGMTASIRIVPKK